GCDQRPSREAVGRLELMNDSSVEAVSRPAGSGPKATEGCSWGESLRAVAFWISTSITRDRVPRNVRYSKYRFRKIRRRCSTCPAVMNANALTLTTRSLATPWRQQASAGISRNKAVVAARTPANSSMRLGQERE